MGLLRNAILFVLILTSGHAQVGANGQQGKIHGVWQNNQFGYQMTLILNTDGSGEFDGVAIKYSVQPNKLSIVMEDTKTDYTYSQQGNSLMLSGGDLDGQVGFTRNGSVTGGTSFSYTSSELLGIWSGNGEMIEFKPDGNCVYLGNTFPYQVSQGHIILTSTQGNSTFGYSVKGKALTLTANGHQVVYKKVMVNLGSKNRS